MDRRIELELAKDSQGHPGVRFFVPAGQMPSLLEALEAAADDGDRHSIDQLLVRIDRLIKKAADDGDAWAANLLNELEQAVRESRRNVLMRA